MTNNTDHTKQEEPYSPETAEELRRKIAELQARLDKLKKPRDDWHSWFMALLKIKFYPYGDKISIESEHVLGQEPPRADYIVIKKDGSLDLKLAIFKIFRRYNIVEFKNPIVNEFRNCRIIGHECPDCGIRDR